MYFQSNRIFRYGKMLSLSFLCIKRFMSVFHTSRDTKALYKSDLSSFFRGNFMFIFFINFMRTHNNCDCILNIYQNKSNNYKKY